jgi:RNA polymerase sigma factor (sigma-70 family)
MRPYLAAMVLGTALAALGQNGKAVANEISGQAICDISRYCTACWRNAHLPVDRWNDCTQEVFQRLLQRLEPEAWEQVLTSEGAERKEFIRAIDAVRKRTQRERRSFPLLEDGLADAKIAAANYQEEKDAVRQAAGQLLSPRQQKILHMLFEGWSIPEVAREIGSTPERVSDEKYKAVQKLRGYFKSNSSQIG